MKKAQVTLEFLLAVTAYSLLILAALQSQNQTRQQFKTTLERIRTYEKIDKTAQRCSYMYIHGRSIQTNETLTLPTKIEKNRLTLEEGEAKAKSTTIAPEATASHEGLVCASLKPWYSKKDR